MRRMYSENQLKKLISEYSGDIIKVSNVKRLTDKQCDSLECGDMVAKKTGNQYHLYLVTYKQAKHGLCLSYFDASVVETQSYDYTEGHWVYNSEDKTSFADIGGLPEVTSADNGSVLEVIAGLWGKGNKKVNKIPASAITPSSMTADMSELITNGAFIEGDLLGMKNPVFFPSYAIEEGFYRGIVIGSSSGKINRISLYNLQAGHLTIEEKILIGASFNNNVIGLSGALLFNERYFPAYPTDNTKQYKLVYKTDNTMAWVEDV